MYVCQIDIYICVFFFPSEAVELGCIDCDVKITSKSVCVQNLEQRM